MYKLFQHLKQGALIDAYVSNVTQKRFSKEIISVKINKTAKGKRSKNYKTRQHLIQMYTTILTYQSENDIYKNRIV